MADYLISLNNDVDFAPSSTAAEVIQNVRTILRTRLGTVPLDRDFGVTWEHLDKPIGIAKMLMKSAVIEAIQNYEPRAEVLSVDYDNNTEGAMTGLLNPKVKINIKED